MLISDNQQQINNSDELNNKFDVAEIGIILRNKAIDDFGWVVGVPKESEPCFVLGYN